MAAGQPNRPNRPNRRNRASPASLRGFRGRPIGSMESMESVSSMIGRHAGKSSLFRGRAIFSKLRNKSGSGFDRILKFEKTNSHQTGRRCRTARPPPAWRGPATPCKAASRARKNRLRSGRPSARLPPRFRHRAPVAQLDRASASGAEGCGFEPRQAHHFPGETSDPLP